MLIVEVVQVQKEASRLLIVVGLIDNTVIDEACVVGSVTEAIKSSPTSVGASYSCGNENFVGSCGKLYKLSLPVTGLSAVAIFIVEHPSCVLLKGANA